MCFGFPQAPQTFNPQDKPRFLGSVCELSGFQAEEGVDASLGWRLSPLKNTST